jgi:hypothetical protein
MKRILMLFVTLMLVVSLTFSNEARPLKGQTLTDPPPPPRPTISVPQNDTSTLRVVVSDAQSSQLIPNMPGWSDPLYAIPYHRPGHLAKTNNAEPVGVAGKMDQAVNLDAALELGVVSDPFQANYQMVDWNQIAVGHNAPNGNYQMEALTAATIITTSPRITAPLPIPGAVFQSLQPMDVAAGSGLGVGDLNNDGQAEAIGVYQSAGVSSTMRLKVASLAGRDGYISAPAAVTFYRSDITKTVEAFFMRGPDDALWMVSCIDGSCSWNHFGGTLASAPAAVSWGPDRLDVVAMGADGAVYHTYSTNGGINWMAWARLGMPSGTSLTLEPALASWGPNRLDLFVRGVDNTLWHLPYTGSWGAWENLAGILTSSPTAAAWGANRLDVFARGYDNELWHLPYAGSWGTWERIGGLQLDSAPSAVAPASGQLQVFARGIDQALWQRTYNGSWSTWSSLGGTLTAAPSATTWGAGRINVAIRDSNFYLQFRYFNGSAWNNWWSYLGGTRSCCYETDTNTAAQNITAVTTGHFLGNGREQVVVISNPDSIHTRIDLLRAHDGFYLETVFSYTATYTDTPGVYSAYDAVAGDFDGDGRDELALGFYSGNILQGLYVRVYDIDQAIKLKGRLTTPDLRTVAAGDFDGDGDDELVYGRVASEVDYIDYHLVDVSQDLMTLTVKGSYRHDCYQVDECRYHVQAGDVNGDGRDEVVAAYYAFNTGSFFNARAIDLMIGAVSDDLDTVTAWDQQGVENPYGPELANTQIAVHVGDLDRDTTDEIVVSQVALDAPGGTAVVVYVYKVNPTVPAPDQGYALARIGQRAVASANNWPVNSVALGNLTGQGLRVGSPTVRKQSDVRGLVALINEPPKHTDVIDGVEYDINGSDTETYAEYQFDQSNSSELSFQAQRDWSLSSEASVTFGDEEGTHLTTSLGSSYGDHFEKTTTAFNKVSESANHRTAGDDVVIYTKTDVEVWEYPLYGNNPNVPESHITVVFPKPGPTNQGTERVVAVGGGCDFWYQPGHQVRNVWSYPKNEAQFSDYNPDDPYSVVRTATGDVGQLETTLTTSWQYTQEEQQKQEMKWDITSSVEGQLGGDKILGFTIPFNIKFKVAGSYGESQAEMQTIKAESETKIVEHFAPITHTGAIYETQSWLYWAEQGYVVLDYITTPQENGSFWARYNKPDPAILRPWADGQCGATRRDYSKEVVIDPAIAPPGAPVTVTATVRNWSPELTTNVVVRFYLGDPAAGGTFLGERTISELADRDIVEVSLPFTASGYGEQRIYAVVDPTNTLAEMHEDNNLGYGLLRVGVSNYADPGQLAAGTGALRATGSVRFAANVASVDAGSGTSNRLDYATYAYTLGGYPVQVSVPLAGLNEVTRFELSPIKTPPAPPSGMTYAAQVFNLAAYQGSTTPVNLTFGSNDHTRPTALVEVRYNPAGGSAELFYRAGTTWQPAACGEVQHDPAQGRLLVPICKTGLYALWQPIDIQPRYQIFLPMVVRNYTPPLAASDLTVPQLNVTGNAIEVVVQNQGNAPVANEFWVDVYVNPTTAPTGVNQTWPMLGTQGLAWGVTGAGLTALQPGGMLTLTLNDAYFRSELSVVSWPLPAGTAVYAQVDSANTNTAYGSVLENHELAGQLYNNIAGPVWSSSAAVLRWLSESLPARRPSDT